MHALAALPLYHGYVLMLSLIVAIGAQNAFLLAHAVHRRYALRIAGLCAAIDAVLVSAGLAGAGGLVRHSIWLSDLLAVAGAGFLLIYGARALLSTLREEHLDAAAILAGSGRDAMIGTLAVSLLNPHVYLDTLVLIGGVGAQYAPSGRWLFGVGAICGSITWFGALGLGGQCLAPLLARPGLWRALNALIGCTLWVSAASLLHPLLS